ncbi:MAG: pknF [Microbacteriaceae bacterium]|nr:pknF [Microbacteriaceae bacterium]
MSQLDVQCYSAGGAIRITAMTNDIARESAQVGSEVGSILAGRYRIDAVIGRGGMATVYRATDEALGRTVALKVFRTDLADADDVRRQQEEIRLIAGLNHFALVTLFDAIADDSSGEHGRAFIVMQYVDGTDLRLRLNEGPLDSRTVAMVGADLAEALAYVHDRGVVHRDIKPANILLPNRENEVTGPQAMLADFGIARIVDATRLTATGSVIGTASYLSPEQATGSALSSATDVYSLGLVLIECLTGVRSFPGTAIETVSARLIRDPEVPEQFGDGWSELLHSMTAREPTARLDALAAAAALRALAMEAPADEPAEEPDAAPTERFPTQVDSDSADSDSADSDSAEATLRYPIVDDHGLGDPTAALAGATAQLDATERMTGAPTPPVDRPPASATPASREPSRRKQGPRRRVQILAAVVALLVIIGLGSWAAVSISRAQSASAGSSSSVQYPAVPGNLGTHLQQLQKAVQP